MGIEPAAAVPSQPDRLDVSRSHHSAGSKKKKKKKNGFMTSFKAQFKLTWSIGVGEEGERRERDKQKRQPGQACPREKRERPLNEQHEKRGVGVFEREIISVGF